MDSRRMRQDQRLEELLVPFLARSYPIEWRERVARSRPRQDLVLAGVLQTLGRIEENTLNTVRRLSLAGVYRRSPVRQFVDAWLVEEQEHGHALREIATVLGAEPSLHEFRGRGGVRGMFATSALRASRPLALVNEAVFAVGGAVNEYVALTTYNYCTTLSRDEPIRSIIHDVAAQEGRHMRFYRNAALIFLEVEKIRPLARAILDALWNPPGLDVFSGQEWIAAFQPLLCNPSFIGSMLRMDDLMDDFPGLEGMHLMSRFLERNWSDAIPRSDHPGLGQDADNARMRALGES